MIESRLRSSARLEPAMTIICMHCKRILDTPANGQKRQIEDERPQLPMGISHGLCPECLEKFYSAYRR
jgi:hypothetical protein